jgi:hypothetical protein
MTTRAEEFISAAQNDPELRSQINSATTPEEELGAASGGFSISINI